MQNKISRVFEVILSVEAEEGEGLEEDEVAEEGRNWDLLWSLLRWWKRKNMR